MHIFANYENPGFLFFRFFSLLCFSQRLRRSLSSSFVRVIVVEVIDFKKLQEITAEKIDFSEVEAYFGGGKLGGQSMEKADDEKSKRKKRLLKEIAKADMRGVCYLSRVPPHMDPTKLRQILSQYGEIQRVFLAPEDPSVQVHRKKAGGFRGQMFSEGWVEFADKRVAKRTANVLNGEQIGGRKRSSFYFDIWNIKYLSKFKWDDLTQEIADKNASREQKLALELSAAKRERDFYLSKVDKSRALSSIEERLKKKQKVEKESGMNSEPPVIQQAPKVIRNFPQREALTDNAAQSKHKLSKDTLAKVFGSS